ncbi:MAG TPA: serine/threonine-protein kinase, partial [Myxococcaceae bacterium]|nr:serine/threonine-protein kinase [Myxococcaceae bacterium]
LTRIQDPRVPRLHDKGWCGPAGDLVFPYFVMEWIEGQPLYQWASRRPLTSREALRVLSQVARALEATHAVDGLHRDVKGDNVRVRSENSEAVLMDFGSGTWRGAPPLTWQALPPNTLAYCSPEALRFYLKWRPHMGASYAATPADDLWAMGVMAYRLVTGEHPPCPVDPDAEEGHDPEPIPAEARVTVCSELAVLIRKMLSREPSARGTAAQLAEALEHAARTAGRKADRPISARRPPASRAVLSWLRPLGAVLARHSKLTAAGVGAGLALGAVWLVQWTGSVPSERQPVAEAEADEASTIALADSELSLKAEPPQPEATQGVAREMPKKPVPGQALAPCKKRFEVEVHGACWVMLGNVKSPCGKDAYDWNGACYLPSAAPKPPPNAVGP